MGDQQRYGRLLHLIILSILQSLINPLAFLLLGLGRARAKKAVTDSRLGSIGGFSCRFSRASVAT